MRFISIGSEEPFWQPQSARRHSSLRGINKYEWRTAWPWLTTSPVRKKGERTPLLSDQEAKQSFETVMLSADIAIVEEML